MYLSCVGTLRSNYYLLESFNHSTQHTHTQSHIPNCGCEKVPLNAIKVEAKHVSEQVSKRNATHSVSPAH